MSAWFALLDAAREVENPPLGLVRALQPFPVAPSLFEPLPDRPPEPFAGGGSPAPDAPDANHLGGFRSSDPSTSRISALRNYPRSGTQRSRILDLALDLGDVTTFECLGRLGLRHETASTRISELVRGGWLEDSGRTRESPAGGVQTVWRPTRAAEDRR